jgi:hypothetical protein
MEFNKNKEALADFNKAIELQPDIPRLTITGDSLP